MKTVIEIYLTITSSLAFLCLLMSVEQRNTKRFLERHLFLRFCDRLHLPENKSEELGHLFFKDQQWRSRLGKNKVETDKVIANLNRFIATIALDAQLKNGDERMVFEKLYLRMGALLRDLRLAAENQDQGPSTRVISERPNSDDSGSVGYRAA